MRILSVRLKNLNSLSGEWSLDFTDPAYAAGGIFAITGPTGAGKSTILDAICLALYGRTPRLGKISKGANEIMSRRSGECQAEVCFVSQKGQFRCTWSQHRARKQARGELQMPKHEIADAVSGKILSSSVRGVAEEIEVATGMDFDRFTRSMLLAQGGFAAFLQAAPDERAPVLEQITGTEIYSHISMRVHEFRGNERHLLHTLQAELAGMHLLPEEEEAQLRLQLGQEEEAEKAQAKRLAQGQEAIAWRETIEALEADLRQLGERQLNLQSRVEAFTPQQVQLDHAMRALELSASHASLSALRREQANDSQALTQCEQEAPEKQARVEQILTAHQTATNNLQSAKTAWQEAQPLLQQARALDVQLAASQGPIKAAEEAGLRLAAQLHEAQSAHAENAKQLASQQQQEAQVLSLLEKHAADASLVEQLASLHNRFGLIKEQAGRLAADEKKISQSETALTGLQQAWQEAQTQQEAAQQERDAAEVLVKEKQGAYQTVLAGQDLSFWRKEQERLTSKRELLSAALGEARGIVQAQALQQQLAGQAAALQEKMALVTTAITQADAQQAGLITERDLLETQLSLLQRIEALEELRQHLQDGEPCPLCGAKEHPYALGNIPRADASRERLAALRADLAKLDKELGQLRATEAKLNLHLEQASLKQQEQHDRQVQAQSRLDSLRPQMPPELPWPDGDEKLAYALESALQHCNAELKRSSATLQQAENLWQQLQAQQEALSKAREAALVAEQEAGQRGSRYQQALEQLQQAQQHLAQAREQQQSLLAHLGQELQPYHLPMLQAGQTLTSTMLDSIAAELQKRLQQWKAWQAAKEASTLAIARLAEQGRQQMVQMVQLQEQVTQQQAQLAQLRQEQETLRQKRCEFFTGKGADTEEARLNGTLSMAEKELEAASQGLQESRQAFEHLQMKASELSKALAARQGTLAQDEAAFSRKLQEAGFMDEAAYLTACLPEAERQQLAQQAQELQLEQAELARQQAGQSARLQEEAARQLSPHSLIELREAQELALQEQKRLQQKLGAIRQRLAANEELKSRQQERAEAINAQQRICAEWDLLHDLIGSSDGKKYRNFAQGLTFELMIGHANRQLQQMSERYLLIHDPQQPLALNVIDNYQAGEIRSTKNLSGGESFIVSLALALGLSSMASRKVRVDSLFLDEGFGSLDEDSLDIALETLAGLRQEGKLIGVISHMQALQERIPTRIRVEPLMGGKSRIIGPGCERLQDKSSGK